MKEFFHGWRRKTGIITLVMACLFATVWVRSLFIEDVVIFLDGFRHHTLISLSGNVYWDSEAESTFDPGRFTWFTYDLRNPTMLASSLESVEEAFRIPYWSITVPLTVLSAYLLLSKPRKQG